MQKVNYGRILDEKLAQLKASGEKPALLLHACCAPCSSHTLLFLCDYFRITLYFFNPNIAPESEYIYRKEELIRLVKELGLDVEIISEDYNPAPFYELAKGLEDLPERGERCRKCIGYRLRKTAETAKKLGCDYFTTSLTISPLKDAQLLNAIGIELGRREGVAWLCSDFKKKNGYKRSCELSAEYGLYRQDYCGCVFSRRERDGRLAAQK